MLSGWRALKAARLKRLTWMMEPTSAGRLVGGLLVKKDGDSEDCSKDTFHMVLRIKMTH